MKIFFLLSVPLMVSAIMYPQSRQNRPAVETKPNFMSLNLKGNLRKYYALEAALINPNANMICSPLSALLPLGKLVLGAEEKTSQELLRAIGPPGRTSLQKSMKKLMKSLRKLSGVQLDIASSIYVSKQASIFKKFLTESRSIFQSGIQKVSFEDPVLSADVINNWVSNKTHGLVGSILTPADILPSTSIILVNAVYFSGKWKYPFNTLPSDGVFFSPSGHRRVKMMKQTSMLNYYKSRVLKSQIIELPYEGGNASLVIILPNDKNGLPLLLKEFKLAPKLLTSEMNKMSLNSIAIVMPKFKVKSDIDLKTLYQRIGVKSIFDEESGLTRMVRNEQLVVSKAVQKVVIDVKEMGTQAGAATAMVVIKMSYIEGVLVEVDHPFLFFIKINSEAIFAGVLNEPQEDLEQEQL